MQIQTLESAISLIPTTGNVFIQGACATPHRLIQELLVQSHRFNDLNLIHLHTTGEAAYADTKYEGRFRVTNLFVGPNIRKKMDYRRIDYLPCFLSQMPDLFRKKVIHLSVALVHVSPPDKHGYCSLGTSVDVTRAALTEADLVIAQINPQMPRVHGDGMIHQSRIDIGVEVDEPLAEALHGSPSKEEAGIGKHVSELIEDGATLQVGIGSIPDAVLASLNHHRDLGIHTEMWSDGVIDLMKKGIINNARKSIHPGRSVASFVSGSKRLFDFMDDNPSIALLDVAYVNNPSVIAKNPKVVAINSAVEIDLTGQVCADSVGRHIISGVGGQMDFMRGASLSEGGKPILAITSRSKQGNPRIVPTLNVGAGVVTTRAHVHYVVTEFGAVNLFGKTIAERARTLISIAHPEDRDNLNRVFSKTNFD